MNRTVATSLHSFELKESAGRTIPRPTPFIVADVSKARLGTLGLSEARLSSLKVLVTTLLSQIETLERQASTEGLSELNLQHEVHQFEAALIRAALAKTGGRQRRAARLLGVKVTTLNTKIKRHKINCNGSFDSASESQASPDERSEMSDKL